MAFGCFGQPGRGQKAASPSLAAWHFCRISDCAEVRSGGTPATGNPRFWNGGIPWVTPSEIANTGKYLEKTVSTISKEGLDNSSAELLPANTVIMCSRATIGPRAILKVPMTTNQGFKNFICKENLDPEFWYYYLDVVIPAFLSCASGNTFKEVSKRDVEQTSVRLPPLVEQRRITAILSACDRVVESKQKLLEEKKRQKRALMRMLMEPEGGDAAFSRVGRTRPEGRITRKMRPLGSFLDFKNGINAPKEQFGSGIKLISVREVLDELPICYNSIRASVDVPEKTIKAYSVEFGDILIQRSSESAQEAGSCNVYLDTKPAVFGGFVIRGKKKADYNPVFFKSLLQSQFVRRQIVGRAAGAQHFNVGQEDLESIIIPVFRKEEQDRIATIFTAADREIDGLAREINAWKEKRKALSQLLLSGKVRV